MQLFQLAKNWFKQGYPGQLRHPPEGRNTLRTSGPDRPIKTGDSAAEAQITIMQSSETSTRSRSAIANNDIAKSFRAYGRIHRLPSRTPGYNHERLKINHANEKKKAKEKRHRSFIDWETNCLLTHTETDQAVRGGRGAELVCGKNNPFIASILQYCPFLPVNIIPGNEHTKRSRSHKLLRFTKHWNTIYRHVRCSSVNIHFSSFLEYWTLLCQ